MLKLSLFDLKRIIKRYAESIVSISETKKKLYLKMNTGIARDSIKAQRRKNKEVKFSFSLFL